MLAILLQGIGLGFSASAMPGPFQSFMVSESLLKGAKKTWLLAFVPIISDIPIVVITMLALNQTSAWFLGALRIVGGIFIIYLAYSAFKASRQTAQNEEVKPINVFKALSINFTNPNVWIYWTTIGASLVITSWHKNKLVAILFFVSFYAAMAVSNLALILLFAKAARNNNRLRMLLLSASILILLGFGLYNLFSGITEFV